MHNGNFGGSGVQLPNEPPSVLLSLLVLKILRFLAHSLARLGHESAASVADS